MPTDDQPPFNPADPTGKDQLDTTHPATDSGLDEQELYDEGVAGAAEATEPPNGDTVAGYQEPEETVSPS